MVLITSMYGQIPNLCGISGEAEHRVYILSHPNIFNRGIINTPPQNNEPKVFNVKFNVFNNEQGTNFCSRNGIAFGEEQFLNYIKILNINYNQFNIFFKYKGYHFYGGSDGNGYITHLGINGINLMFGLHGSENININFLNQLTPYSGIIPSETTPTVVGTEVLFTNQTASGRAVFGSPIIFVNLPSFMGITTNGIGNSMSYFSFHKNFLLCHEMGHTLGLFHTFMGSNPCEHVERNPLGQYFNADVTGDLIVDTPAQTYLDHTQFSQNTCYYDPTAPGIQTDCQGTPWESANLRLNNFMQYCFRDTVDNPSTNKDSCVGFDATDSNVLYQFTLKQGEFMRNYIDNIPSNIFPKVTDALTDVSELYQPFYVGIGSGYNNGTTVNSYSKTISINTNNTGINIWNCGPFKMRFQGGFDQEFSNLSGGLISQSKYQHYDAIVGENTFVGVKIPILGQTIFNNNSPVCFNTFEPFTSGEVISTTNLGSQSYSQEELDAIKAKDPDLYNSLQS